MEKWLSNIFGRSYKILFIIRGTFFTAKHTSLGTKYVFIFIFCEIYYSKYFGKDWFKLKISLKFLNFQNSILGLKFEYIWYQMSFKKRMMGLKWMSLCV